LADNGVNALFAMPGMAVFWHWHEVACWAVEHPVRTKVVATKMMEMVFFMV
jgi:hypothetical protein